MIDLSKQNSKPYEIKMFDGTILKIEKPTQQMLLDLVKLQEEEDTGLALEKLGEMLLKILNRNTNKKVYTEEILEQFSIEMVAAVIQDYISYSFNLLGE